MKEEITTAILKVFHDETLRKELILKGHKQVEKYSWEKMASETLEIYLENK